ncbi:hypothetical protein H1Q78_17055 [Cellulosimicrobium cellulans]|uniref:hypothetical protein n=1 Tax=Cellulosimicrobium cellulans TaxID=1710 RepID=UPI001EDC5A81|nr:hypothetical protein [Cellulosimicrobium cellulans]UKJ63349.1 hypothetical protein H1Q78_17055 [Cellulosimicrobium cellulans]
MTTDDGGVDRAATDEPGERELDVVETLRVIREQQDHARDATEPDTRLLCLAWGVAWLVGYLCLWVSAVRVADGADVVRLRSGAGQVVGAQPEPWAFWVFFSLIASATVFTIVHSVTRTAGTRGVSARTGAMYGWSWMLGFVCYGFVLGGLARAGASTEVMALASNAFACIVVGLLYLGGAVAFDSRGLFVLGVWILVTAAAATFAGLPFTYLVMALAGGGGFLVMAGVEHVLRVRRRRPGPGPALAGGRGSVDA